MATTKTPYASYGDVDIEKGAQMSAFADSIIRKAFIKKVFGLLAVQLALTTAIAGAMVASGQTKAMMINNPWILHLSFFGSFGTLMSMVISDKLRHTHPTNLIMLFAFTAFEGVLVGAVSSMYATSIVVTAFAITAAMTTALCGYALTTKDDFTTKGGMLISCLFALLIASVMGIFFHTPLLELGISFGGAILFSAFIVYDVQKMMGGNHKFSISPDEYVFAAIGIYLDIINLFLHILRILNQMRGEN